MSRRTYRFSATVNGKRREATFTTDPEAWGNEPGADLSLSDAEVYVDNTHDAYRAFFKGATDADYDAERVDAKLEVFGWTTLEDEAEEA